MPAIHVRDEYTGRTVLIQEDGSRPEITLRDASTGGWVTFPARDGSEAGGDDARIPTPAPADAGKTLIANDQGAYVLGAAGGADTAKPQSVARSSRTFTPETTFASINLTDFSLELTDTDNTTTINVLATDTVETFIGRIQLTGYKAGLDPLGRLVIWTGNGKLLGVTANAVASNRVAVDAIFGLPDSTAIYYVDATAATEAELRRVIALGIDIARRNPSRLVLSRAAAGLHTLAAEIVIARRIARNWGLVGQEPVVLSPVGAYSLTGVVSVGQTTPHGVPLYDLVFSSSSADVIDGTPFVIGSVVGIEGVLTGDVSVDWPMVCGSGVIIDRNSGALQIRIASWVDPTSVKNIPTNGANSVAFKFWRYPTQVVAAAQMSAFRIVNSDFLGIHGFGMKGSGAPANASGIYVQGAGSRLALGNNALHAFPNWPIVTASLPTVSATIPDSAERAAFGFTRLFSNASGAGPSSYFDAMLDLTEAAVVASTGHSYEGLLAFGGNIKLPDNTIIGGVGSHAFFSYKKGEITAPVSKNTIRAWNGRNGGFVAIKAEINAQILANGLNSNPKNSSSPPLNSTGGNFNSLIYDY